MNKIPVFELGMESPEVVSALIDSHPDIEYVKLQEYEPHALGVTQELQEKPEVPVKTLIRHHPDAGEYLITLQREEVSVKKIRDLIAIATSRKRALVLCSKVESRDDDILHIPMLDFECSVSSDNLCKIKQFLIEMNTPGLILESGRSYHFYGFNLLSVSEWNRFMQRTGLFTGFTDSRHIFHRLLSREARLRLAKIEGSERYLMTPRVVSMASSDNGKWIVV